MKDLFLMNPRAGRIGQELDMTAYGFIKNEEAAMGSDRILGERIADMEPMGMGAATQANINKPLCARERTAREVLDDLFLKATYEREDLLELMKALPQELPYRADRALRRLIQK